ncbi:MAG: 30S ribosomal protein S6 [Bacteroidota bacterium]
MRNRYETVFILTPVLSEDQAKDAVKNFKSFLKDQGADIKFDEEWGLRKLAYPIQKKTTGFYFLFEFEADGEAIDKFETMFRRDERVIRFLTIKMDKDHVEYAERRRNKKKEEPNVKSA